MTKSNLFPLSFGKCFNYIIQEFWWGALQCDQSSQFACNFRFSTEHSQETPVLCQRGWLVTPRPAITRGFSITYSSIICPQKNSSAILISIYLKSTCIFSLLEFRS